MIDLLVCCLRMKRQSVVLKPLAFKHKIIGLFLLIGLVPAGATAQSSAFSSDEFLYGASVYPELQTWEESLAMLDHFEKAHMTVLRVGESAWGNLEPEPGKYDFGWLRRFLDEMHRRGLKAILGTNSYIAPQWLLASHPDMIIALSPGKPVNPLVRKAASIHHPVYRKAVRDFLTAFSAAFKDHPAVIGWQLDNEIDALFDKVDYSTASQRAFTEWLKTQYQSADSLNQQWGLQAWGMEVKQIEDIQLPSPGIEGGTPVVELAYQRFVRDAIADFLAEMATVIRQSGASQWITSNFMAHPHLGYDAALDSTLSVNSLNVYAASNTEAGGWSSLAQHFDLSRSARASNSFLVAESRFGVMGDARIWDPVASPAQFKMMNLLPVTYGAVGSIYWTGNRYTSGHWPHWGGLLDWSGQPEADFNLAIELGDFYKKWGTKLLENSVSTTAAILSDYDQVMAHRAYPHTSNNVGQYTTTAFFEAFHRLGIGVDGLTVAQARQPERVTAYDIIVVSATSVLDDKQVMTSLQQFVKNGGTLVVTPLVSYQTTDGVFKKTGFTTNFQSLTGCLVRTVRLIKLEGEDGHTPQWVTTDQDSVRIGAEGFCEFIERTDTVTAVLGSFAVDDPYLNGKPAMLRRKMGKGTVYKLAFWPPTAQMPELIKMLYSYDNGFFDQILPQALHAIPREDSSLFVVNTTNQMIKLELAKPRVDRLTGEQKSVNSTLSAYQIVWLE